MSARHWMIGCLIGLAGMGSAMASDMDVGSVTASAHGTVDTSARDAGGSNGDALGLNRDTAASRRDGNGDATGDNDARGSGTAGGSEHGGHISAPTQARPAALGWQSLLPGSIQ